MVHRTTPSALVPMPIGGKIGSMLKCLIAMTSLLSAAAIAEPAWTWVDEQGRRHYSDRPVDGATQIELAGPQTFSSQSPETAPQSSADAEASDATPAGYTVLDVISPAQEETLSNIGGTMTIELAVYPRLQAGHSIDVVMDEQYLALGSRELSVTLTEVFRGEHVFQAVIVNSEGIELMRSDPVTVYVRQTSIQ